MCRKCSAVLRSGSGGNWTPYLTKTRRFECRACNSRRAAGWVKRNPEKAKTTRRLYDEAGRAERVYVIVSPVFPGYVKIGRTGQRPNSRLRIYNTGDPLRRYTYAALVSVKDAVTAERQLLRALAPRREGETEWVRVHEKLAIALAERLQTREGPTCPTTN